jgi:hypothetical protein
MFFRKRKRIPLAYEVLGLELDASEADIKAAYKRLVKAHHPDLHENDRRSIARLKLINRAYEILTAPTRSSRAPSNSLNRLAIGRSGARRFRLSMLKMPAMGACFAFLGFGVIYMFQSRPREETAPPPRVHVIVIPNPQISTQKSDLEAIFRPQPPSALSHTQSVRLPAPQSETDLAPPPQVAAPAAQAPRRKLLQTPRRITLAPIPQPQKSRTPVSRASVPRPADPGVRDILAGGL